MVKFLIIITQIYNSILTMFFNAKDNQIARLICKERIRLRKKTLHYFVLVQLVIITNKCKDNYKSLR